MSKKIRSLAALIVAMLLVPIARAEGVALDGLWENRQVPGRYFSIHVYRETIVLVDLHRMEEGAPALAAAYVGTARDYVLKPLANLPGSASANWSLRLIVRNSGEVLLTPVVSDPPPPLFDPFVIDLQKVVQGCISE